MHGEAHHVCHRCGWTYPNPHPSSKHRRHHKKVCGKLEGFKVIDSENDTHLVVSDDEHHSDEDHNKVAETSSNVKGNGETDKQVLIKSEEEAAITATDSTNQVSKDPSNDTSENVEAPMVTDTNLNHTSSLEGGESIEGNVEVTQVVEEDLQLEENGSKIVIQEELVESQIDDSVTKDSIGKEFVSDLAEEAFTGTKINGLSSTETEKDQIVSSFGVQEEVSETLLVVAADEKTIVSSSDVVIHEGIDAKSDQAGVSEAVNSEMPESLIVADRVSEKLTETISDAPRCHDEDIQEGSKELDDSKTAIISSSSETEVQIEHTNADSLVTKSIHEEMELNHGDDAGLSQNCPENTTIEESVMLSAAESKLGLPSSGKVEDNNAKISSETTTVAPPVLSVDPITQTECTNGNRDFISDSIDASKSEDSPLEEAEIADSEKTKNAPLVEVSKEGDIKAATSEIQAVENPQQVQPSSEMGSLPSITQVVNESEGGKETEDITEKETSWNHGKPHTPLKSLLVEANLESKQRAKTAETYLTDQKIDAPTAQEDNGNSAKSNIDPTNAVGVEVNEKAKTAETHPTLPPTQKTDAQVDEEKINVTEKSNEEKEWNSPARLPVAMSREKRKNKHWIPFMCCSSSVVN